VGEDAGTELPAPMLTTWLVAGGVHAPLLKKL